MLACLASENWIGLPDGLPESSQYFEVSRENGRIVLTPVCLADGEAAHEWLPELVQTARHWLVAADREFDAERDLAAARCLWEAVRAAVTAVSVKRGATVETDADMFAFVAALDKEVGLNHTLSTEFGVARILKRNAEEIDNYCENRWDGFEFDTGHLAVKRLIERLTEMVSA